jgi:hypothetical protein
MLRRVLCKRNQPYSISPMPSAESDSDVEWSPSEGVFGPGLNDHGEFNLIGEEEPCDGGSDDSAAGDHVAQMPFRRPRFCTLLLPAFGGSVARPYQVRAIQLRQSSLLS